MSFVSMSSCFLLFTASAFAGQQQASGRLRHNVTLQCQAPRGVTITVLEWTRTDLKPDEYVFLYRNARPYEKYQHEYFRGRVVLKESKVADGDASVVLNNISASDAGTYVCCVTLSNMEIFKTIVSLSVEAPGSAAEADEDGGKPEKVYDDANHELNVGLVVGLCAAVVFVVVCVAGLLIVKKQPLYRPATEKTERQQQV